MTENKILKLEFSARSEAAGKLTEQQSECLDHEIQTNPQPTESYEIHWNLDLRKPQPFSTALTGIAMCKCSTHTQMLS